MPSQPLQIPGGEPVLPISLERYQLYDLIATGGMAQVHVGRLRASAGFARTVAIKRLLPSVAEQRELVAVLADEARVAARIRHPNVVQTLDVVSRDGELFLVMEYVHGESLAHILRAQGPEAKAPLDVVAAIFSGVLRGLHAAHDAVSETGASLEIVHRDVSPQNILLGADGTARLLDFGIAKAVGRSQQVTHEGEIKGKLAYMSPEQLSGVAVDRRTDVYAVGVVLWEVLTGRRRFTGEPADLVLDVLEANSIAPSSIAGPASAVLDTIVLRALSIDRDRRFATALEMAAAIEQAVAPAAPSVVGAWVQGLVGARLDARMRRLMEIEAISESALKLAPVAQNDVVEAGSVLMDRYRMTSVIGTSEMATVWAGVHAKLHHGIAIKFLKDTASPQAAARFRREAEAMARVRSPHVVSVQDVGTTANGTPYIVMELLQGEDLAAVLARGTFTVADAVQYVTQACEGLAAAHALGIVHRDVKPTNLFVTRTPDGAPLVKLIDFGIAKFTIADVDGEESASDIDLTKTQTLVGSPRYMAPEQIRSARSVEPRSDIWALGVILYQLVSGRRAFDGESTGEVLGKILFAEPTPLHELCPNAPPAFLRIVEKCMKKAPEERFGSIAELSRALAGFDQAEVVEAVATTGTHPTHERRRNKSRWMPIALVTALGVLIAGGGTLAYRRAQTKAAHASAIAAAAEPAAPLESSTPLAAAARADLPAPPTPSAAPATSTAPPTARGVRSRPVGGARGPRPPTTSYTTEAY